MDTKNIRAEVLNAVIIQQVWQQLKFAI